MGKNPHPPRGGASKKPAAPVEPAAATGGKDTKKGKAAPPPPAQQDGKKGKKATDNTAGPSEPADAPKKPDTRTLIGGASWTGKLPVNLLSELCQKRKWERPEYDMRGNQQHGFVSAARLSRRDPKTRELTSLNPFTFPPDHKAIATQETALEARHFAATYALFRLCSMQNMHLMLPPKYKDLWKGLFTELKKEDVAQGKTLRYENDPFAAMEELARNQAAAQKKREEAQKEREKREANVGPGGLSLNKNGPGRGAWERAIDVDMGKKIRFEVEKIIRAHTVWNPISINLRKRFDRVYIERMKADLVGRGFRPSHVEEAFDICKDAEEVIEWLITHVPEDDLPAWALPENYIAGVAIASTDMKREAAIARLTLGGYAKDLCEEALDACNGDLSRAAAVLQEHLMGSAEDLKNLAQSMQVLSVDEQADEAWNDEMEVLSSIYGDDFSTTSPGLCSVKCTPSDTRQKQLTAHIRKPIGGYPNVLPIISLDSSLPSYIRLSVIKKALQYCQENLLGEQIIFSLVDWLSQNIGEIANNPGPLSDIASATAVGGSNERQRQARSSRHRPPRPIDWTAGTKASQQILDDWIARQSTPKQQQMLSKRRTLPAWQLQETIIDAVNTHRVTIISGETGSGKSTQSVQFILDDMIRRSLGGAANIICTQPRRISALGLADRVAEERCSTVGQEVGYTIRGESKAKAGLTRITFVTTGVLLRRLQMAGGNPDETAAALADVSHVVVDEVHERSLDTDFLLILLRDILHRRKDLKVILMSATLDAELFAGYFRGTGAVAKIEIQGRTYPVTDYYLDDVLHFTGFSGGQTAKDGDEDVQDSMMDGRRAPTMGAALRKVGMQINYELIVQTVQYIDSQLGDKEGGILIFLPGTMEIDRCIQALRAMSALHVLPLHASLLPAEQKRVFPPAPQGKRKVIASTNVAETSITIEDIVAVIDTGRVKETSFDPQSGMVKLEEVWASQAACKQRRGRSGRVQAGTCYKLFTRNAESKMAARPDPEIRRVPLEQLCLSVKAMGVNDAAGFLASALTPPDSLAVEGAIRLLRRMGAIDSDGYLTALGRHLSMIPADLRCGKLLVYGATFGCLEACLTMAAILSVRSPFVSPREKREESKAARAKFGATNGANGDLVADLRAFEEWSGLRSKAARWETQEWCSENFVSSNTMFDIASTKSQFVSSLKEIGFIPMSYSSRAASSDTTASDPQNAHNDNTPLLRALVAGAFNPQIARIEYPSKKFAPSMSGAIELDPEARTIKYFTKTPEALDTTIPAAAQPPVSKGTSERVFLHPSSTLFDAQQFAGTPHFLSYFERIATSKVFMRNVTPFGVYALLLFCGDIAIDPQGRGLTVDGYFRLKGWARIGVLASRLRGVLDALLERKIDEPEFDLSGHEVVVVVRRLVALDGMDA